MLRCIYYDNCSCVDTTLHNRVSDEPIKAENRPLNRVSKDVVTSVFFSYFERTFGVFVIFCDHHSALIVDHSVLEYRRSYLLSFLFDSSEDDSVIVRDVFEIPNRGQRIVFILLFGDERKQPEFGTGCVRVLTGFFEEFFGTVGIL